MEQTVKIITYRGKDGVDGKDAPDLKPYLIEQLKSLEGTLRAFVGATTDNMSLKVSEALSTLESWKSSQELANGTFDSGISEIETKVNEILNELTLKATKSELEVAFSGFRSDLLKIVNNINVSLKDKVTKSDLEKVSSDLKGLIPEAITVVSKSENVTVTKEGNSFGVAVSIPEVTREVTKEIEVRGGGGISKAAVQRLIDEAIAGIDISGGGTYIPLEITSLTGGLQAEIGDTVASVTLDWTYNKAVTSQSLDEGIGSLPIGDRTYTYSTPLTTNTTFTLTGSDGTTTDTANTSVTFVSRRFWGVTSSDVELLEAEIEAGSSELSGSRAKAITFDCTGGKRIFFAYPKSLGLATVRDGNGNKFTDWLLSTSPYEITLINTFGYSQVYYVYHSKNVYNSATVEFSWS